MKQFAVTLLLISASSYLVFNSQGYLVNSNVKIHNNSFFKKQQLLYQQRKNLLTSAAIHGASLDHRLIPSRYFPASIGSSSFALTVSMLLVATIVQLKWQEISGFLSNVFKKLWNLRNTNILRRSLRSPLPLTQNGANTRATVRQPIRQQIRQPIGTATAQSKNSPVLPLKNVEDSSQKTESSNDGQSSTWKTCRFERKEILNSEYQLYKFRIPQDFSPSMFEVGKKVVLVTTDKDGKVVKGRYYPLPSIYSKSSFEIVIPVDGEGNEEKDKMAQALASLQLDDEVAIKIDHSSTLKYRGTDDSIEFLTLIASGLGIIPVLQLLRRIFKGDLFQIDSCELLWINPSKDAFIYNHEIEKLEAEHGDKFSVARVLDVNVGSENTMLNPRLIENLPVYRSGRVSVIAGEEVVSAKFVSALSEKLGYAKENIVSFQF